MEAYKYKKDLRPDPFRGWGLEELYFVTNSQLAETHSLFKLTIHSDPQVSRSPPNQMCVAFPNTVLSVVSWTVRLGRDYLRSISFYL